MLFRLVEQEAVVDVALTIPTGGDGDAVLEGPVPRHRVAVFSMNRQKADRSESLAFIIPKNLRDLVPVERDPALRRPVPVAHVRHINKYAALLVAPLRSVRASASRAAAKVAPPGAWRRAPALLRPWPRRLARRGAALALGRDLRARRLAGRGPRSLLRRGVVARPAPAPVPARAAPSLRPRAAQPPARRPPAAASWPDRRQRPSAPQTQTTGGFSAFSTVLVVNRRERPRTKFLPAAPNAMSGPRASRF